MSQAGVTLESVSEPFRWRRPGRFWRDLSMTALLTLIAASAALLLLPRTDDGLLGLPEFAMGEPSPRTVRSHRAFTVEDPGSTASRRLQAAESVSMVYSHLLWVSAETRRRLQAAFQAVERSPEDADQVAQVRDFMLALGVTVDENILLPVMEPERRERVRDASSMVTEVLFETRIAEDKGLLALHLSARGIDVRVMQTPDQVEDEVRLQKLDTVLGIEQARARVDEIVADRLAHLAPVESRAVASLVKKVVRPNLVPQPDESERRKRAAAAAVKPALYQVAAGEVVVREGQIVGEQQRLLLAGLRRDLDGQSRTQLLAGSAVFALLFVLLAYRIARRSYDKRPQHADLVFLTSAYILTLVVFWAGYKLGPELAATMGWPPQYVRLLIPVAFGTLLVRMVAGIEAAAVFTPLVGITAGWMMDASLPFAAYATFGALAAASSADRQSPRGALVQAGFRVCAAQAGAVVVMTLLASRYSGDFGVELAAAVGSGVIAVIMTAMILPLVELLFGYTSGPRLHDLANLNHPLLKELLVEAPGTYHHSITVGDLAAAGAEAIQANSVLARVGGYYHDIGKLEQPRAFIENDQGQFPHPNPEEEAAVLRSHVEHGLKLAASYRLGAVVQEIIAQHHGNSVVRNPWQRARERGVVDDALFEYQGPRPQSKEAALVMLADIVERLSVSFEESVSLAPEDIQAVVRRAVNEVLADGQLDACDLTLKDVGLVIAAFSELLAKRTLRRPGGPMPSSGPFSPAQIVRPPPGGEPN